MPCHQVARSLVVFLPHVCRHPFGYLVLGAALFFADTTTRQVAYGQTRIWSVADGAWTTGANWSPMSQPTSTSDAEINNLGTATLSSGANGTSRDLYLGRTAGTKGTVNILGSSVLTSRDGWVGDAGEGLVLVSNSSDWNTSNLTVGNSGKGTLNILDFGEVTTTGFAYVGRNSTGDGNVLVDLFTTWTINLALNVGNSGKGTLEVRKGLVTSSSGNVGSLSGSDGAVTIDGFNDPAFLGIPRWKMTAGLTVGLVGSGVVQVIKMGSIESGGGTLGGSTTSHGIVRLDAGGWKNNGGLSISSNGELTAKHGSFFTSTTGNISGVDIDNPATMLLEDTSGWTASSYLTVGNTGYGKLTIASKSDVKNTDAWIGLSSGSDGEVFVRGEDSSWENSGRLVVGDAGSGKLSISEKGLVKSATGIIADSIGGKSLAIVDGAGSKWEVTGVGQNNHALLVGDTNGSGTEGTLVVRNGGEVSVIPGQNVTVLGKGVVSGTGKIVGNVVSGSNDASVDPGYVHELTDENIRGSLEVQGNYQQFGRLKIDLGSDLIDKLAVTGNVQFISFFTSSRVEVALAPGFNPTSGQSFDILDWGGTFSGSPVFQLPALPGGLSWNTSQFSVNGSISVQGTSTLAAVDLSNNGVVDAADFVAWRNSNLPASKYNEIRAAFGNVAAGAGTGAAAVPEPSCGALLLIAVGVAILRRS